MQALSAGNVGTIEQNNNALLAATAEALNYLDTFPRFGMDLSLKAAAINMFQFYTLQSREYIPRMVSFQLVKERFEKIRAAFETKKPAQRKQIDVDQYNQTVNEYNTALKEYNEANDALNRKRREAFDSWNKAVEGFFAQHVP